MLAAGEDFFTPATGNMTGFINSQSAEIHLGKTQLLEIVMIFLALSE